MKRTIKNKSVKSIYYRLKKIRGVSMNDNDEIYHIGLLVPVIYIVQKSVVSPDRSSYFLKKS